MSVARSFINEFETELKEIVNQYFSAAVYFTDECNFKESGISSVVIKVRGAGLSNMSVWDAVDYVYPPQNDERSRCFNDSDCTSDWRTENGVKTGECDSASGMCKIRAWCPIEKEQSTTTNTTYIKGASNFTVVIRNHEEFVELKQTRSNDPSSVLSSTNCLFNPITDPTCPIFKISDILREGNVTFKDVKKMGGVFQFYIKWNCYFNRYSGQCMPKYFFKRIARENNDEFSGYSMRYAVYQDKDGVRQRDLVTVYGLRFLIMIKSTGQERRFTVFAERVGSYLSYLSAWTILIWLIYEGYFYVFRPRKWEAIPAKTLERLIDCAPELVNMTNHNGGTKV